LSDRLDEAKIEQLRAWGAGLYADGNDDFRATGKAILLLIEEIERLHIDLWNAKSPREETEVEYGEPEVQAQASLERTLRGRLSRIRSR
jgi:hypothetical protein